MFQSLFRSPPRTTTRRFTILVAGFLLASVGPHGDVRCRETDDEDGSFRVVASLGKRIRGTDFYEVTYREIVGRKRVKTTILVKISASTPLFRDRAGKLTELARGDTVHVFAKPEEREVIDPQRGVVVGTDRFLRQGLLIARGERIKVDDSFRSKKPGQSEHRWCQAAVERGGGKAQVTVRFQGNSYLVTTDKKCRVILRVGIPDDIKEKRRRKLLRRGTAVVVTATPTADVAESGSKKAGEATRAYVATRVVLVPRNMTGYYGTMLRIE